MVFDTGSANMWVPDIACAAYSTNCEDKKAFNLTASSSFAEVGVNATTRFAIMYGSGPVTGTFGVDTVTLAEDYTVEEQTLAFVLSSIFRRLASLKRLSLSVLIIWSFTNVFKAQCV